MRPRTPSGAGNGEKGRLERAGPRSGGRPFIGSIEAHAANGREGSRVTRAKLTIAAVLLGTSGLVAQGSATEACATSNIFFRLDGFPPGISRPAFYYAAEDEGSTNFVVRRTGDDCEGTVADVAYDVRSGSAIAAQDYAEATGRTDPLFDPFHGTGPDRQTISVDVVDDGAQEPVESATVELSDPKEVPATSRIVHLAAPSSAPLYIVDDEGATRFSFGDEVHSQSERSTSVGLPVFRPGDASAAASVSFDIQPGTASPGGDYVAPTTGTLNFGVGERMKLISFSLVDDGVVEPEETIQVSLTGDVVPPSSLTMSILNDDVAEGIEPTSRLHHPRQGGRYPPDQFAGMGVHILTHDNEGGSGVVKAQFALRRTMKSGACAWWTRDGFDRGSCSAKNWIRGRQLQEGAYYVYTIKRLRPSVGTSIRNYKMWCRAFDGADNVETSFERNRNANSFEITRR